MPMAGILPEAAASITDPAAIFSPFVGDVRTSSQRSSRQVRPWEGSGDGRASSRWVRARELFLRARGLKKPVLAPIRDAYSPASCAVGNESALACLAAGSSRPTLAFFANGCQPLLRGSVAGAAAQEQCRADRAGGDQASQTASMDGVCVQVFLPVTRDGVGTSRRDLLGGV